MLWDFLCGGLGRGCKRLLGICRHPDFCFRVGTGGGNFFVSRSLGRVVRPMAGGRPMGDFRVCQGLFLLPGKRFCVIAPAFSR